MLDRVDQLSLRRRLTISKTPAPTLSAPIVAYVHKAVGPVKGRVPPGSSGVREFSTAPKSPARCVASITTVRGVVSRTNPAGASFSVSVYVPQTTFLIANPPSAALASMPRLSLTVTE